MSLVERGRDAAAERDAEDFRRREFQKDRDRKHMVSRFYWDFDYDFKRGYLIRNPDRYAYKRLIPNPEKPRPPITLLAGNGGYHERTRFTCEGLIFEVTWRYEGGWDRAEWDDGWWPDWVLITGKFLKKRTKVYGCESIARALS